MIFALFDLNSKRLDVLDEGAAPARTAVFIELVPQQAARLQPHVGVAVAVKALIGSALRGAQ